MALVLFFAAWVDAQVPLLGHDDWVVREAAQARLDHFLPALFLPFRSDDPEVNHRLRELRRRNLKWVNPAHLERRLFAADFESWCAIYLFAGRSAFAEDFDAFAAIHADNAKAQVVFRHWSPWGEFGGGGFLTGAVCPGEYEKYLAFLDYHLHRAPMPRETP